MSELRDALGELIARQLSGDSELAGLAIAEVIFARYAVLPHKYASGEA